MYDIKESGSLTCKGFIGHVRPLQPPAIFEIPLVDGSFMTHHSLDMNYIFTDKRFAVCCENFCVLSIIVCVFFFINKNCERYFPFVSIR